ncbi:MAG: PQQ-binding-like beta-propeller repeat protein [Actinomycetota bacterium]
MNRLLLFALLVVGLLAAATSVSAGAAGDAAAPPNPSCRPPDGEPVTGCLPGGLGLSGVAAATAPSIPSVLDHPAGACTPVQGTDDRCEAWTATYDDPDVATGSHQFPSGLALSPDGRVAYAALMDTAFDAGNPYDTKSRWAVVATDVATGEPRWVARWGAPDAYSFPAAVAVSPDGATVYVAGSTRPAQGDIDSHLRVIAFAASTGDVRWIGTYDGPGGGVDNAMGLVVSADGARVFAAVVSDSNPGMNGEYPAEDLDIAVVGYDTATGAQVWASRYAGPKKDGVDSPFGFGISPDGTAVFVTGWSYIGDDYDVDYATIAYDAATGKQRWVARYDGVGIHGADEPFGLAVSSDGRRVYVTGMSNDGTVPFAVNYRYGTVAYDAATGAQLWEASYHPAGWSFSSPFQIVVSPTGDRVFVTGELSSSQVLVGTPRVGTADTNFGTVAYDGATGHQLWSAEFGTPQFDFEFGIDVASSPDGGTAYVTGVSSSSKSQYALLGSGQLADQVTLAYDGATGAQRWVARLNMTGYDFDIGKGVAVTPDGGTVVTLSELDHQIAQNDNTYDVGLAAYRTAG